jgi:membrane associated rhomboid family serine protease
MFMPIGDDNTGRHLTPVVTYVLIGLNVLVFVLFQGLGSNQRFTYAFSTVPAEIVSGDDAVTDDRVVVDPGSGQRVLVPGLQPTPLSVYLTLLTSMFMHGGIAHLLGNMLFLWIFGDNVEDSQGHRRFVAFYLLCGLLASLTHVASTMAFRGNPFIPSLGASGAISGVLGGYLVLHPHRRVRVLMWNRITEVPALMAIGMWFVFQVVSGLGALGGMGGGVAYGAHIGGFLAGLVLVRPFTPGARPMRPEASRFGA